MSPPPRKKSSVLVALDSDFDSESSDGEEANKADTQVDHHDDAEHSDEETTTIHTPPPTVTKKRKRKGNKGTVVCTRYLIF
jgi:hypothetical protein